MHKHRIHDNYTVLMDNKNSIAKRDYLIRTLSRTKRKDYENYVVNAIWNRLGIFDLKPVTQQAVFWPNHHRSFIDLYFPQIGIGVECDEGYHNGAEQHERDLEREVTIIDVLRQVKSEDYRALHVDATLPYEEFEQAIDDVVATIRTEIDKRKADGTFEPWNEVNNDWQTYFQDKDQITVHDDITFPRIVDAINTVCNDNKKGYQQSFIIPSGLRKVYGSEYRMWFPKLAVEGKAVARGWNNQLSEDGLIIEDYNEDESFTLEPISLEEAHKDKRIIFAQTRDPITRERAYRFVGVFRRIENAEDGSRSRHERIADSFPLINR